MPNLSEVLGNAAKNALNAMQNRVKFSTLYRTPWYGGDVLTLRDESNTLTGEVYGDARPVGTDANGKVIYSMHVIVGAKFYSVFCYDYRDDASEPKDNEQVTLEFRDADSDGDEDVVLV